MLIVELLLAAILIVAALAYRELSAVRRMLSDWHAIWANMPLHATQHEAKQVVTLLEETNHLLATRIRDPRV